MDERISQMLGGIDKSVIEKLKASLDKPKKMQLFITHIKNNNIEEAKESHKMEILLSIIFGIGCVYKREDNEIGTMSGIQQLTGKLPTIDTKIKILKGQYYFNIINDCLYSQVGFEIFNQLPIDHSLEYWKKRCELAEKFIAESPDDPDVTNSQYDAYWEWKDFIKNGAEREIVPSRLHEADKPGELHLSEFQAEKHLKHIKYNQGDRFDLESETYFPLYVVGIKYKKLLVVQTIPEIKIWFKDEEITAETLMEILENSTLQDHTAIPEQPSPEEYTKKEDKPCQE